jgi:aspartate aminotransferase
VKSPEGAFYIFLGISKYLQANEDSFGFCERLLNESKVAAVPGTPFGEPGFVRLSFALDDRSLQEGCNRIVQFLNK